MNFVNIAAYRFVRLDGLLELRNRLKKRCLELGLKGTILLSPEGINFFLAGVAEAIDAWLADFEQIAEFRGLEPKQSLSSEQPFNRLLVKIKREIIGFGRPEVDPVRDAAPRLSAVELKAWLDEQKDFTLLDVRNDYEIEVGTFSKAAPLGIRHFRDFPAAIARLDADRDKPVVMFCTGGIRCEKAAPYLLQNGFRQVFHLDGGILKYFEQVGGAHYAGDCFVFDKRVAVDPQLHESATSQCFVCQAILSATDLESEKYRLGESCPHCFVESSERWSRIVRQRQSDLDRICKVLPGQVPYDNPRPLNVPGAFDGFRLIEFLTAAHPQFGRENWRAAIEQGRVQSRGRVLAGDDTVRGGYRLFHLIPHDVEPPVDAAIKILHEDEAIIVVNKPAPLPVHPCGRFNRNSLVRILDLVYRPLYPRPPHRLDANTTGLVILAKSRRFAHDLQAQFERRSVRKFYLAKVQGSPLESEFSIDIPIGRKPIDRGRRQVDADGAISRTLCRSAHLEEDGTSILIAQPLTGRTNQIRIHLWQAGWPIVGDPMYGPNVLTNTCPTLSPGDPPMCLHHWRIQLVHPLTKIEVEFQAPWPRWLDLSTQDRVLKAALESGRSNVVASGATVHS